MSRALEWERAGLLYAPSGERAWARSHASLPTGLSLGDGRWRVYFASRDDRDRSHIGWVEVDLSATPRVVTECEKPVLEPGPLGHFDDHGVYPASLVEADGRLLLYYIGWSPGAERPLFYSSIGLAASDDGGLTFQRERVSPLLARSEVDPCLVTSPCVLRDGDRWRMWYVSGFKWTRDADGLHSWYDVKYAESADGRDWGRAGHAAIALAEGERNIARPWVLRDDAGYRMWYSHAGDRYRLGYAESADGVDWRRLDELTGIEPSGSGWDTESISYAWVAREGERLLMLYNGDGFGRTGFGAAVALSP